MLMAEKQKGIVVPSFEEAQGILEQDLGNERMRWNEVMQYRELFDRLGLKSDGVHDIYHAGRVLVIGGNLGRWEAKTGARIRTREIETVSVHHDRLRQHDGYDWFHGLRAALALRREFAGESLDLDFVLMQKLCSWHVLPDLFTPRQIREIPEMKIFEDADALDRHNNRGRVNLNFLRLKKSITLLPLAEKLHIQTEVKRSQIVHPLELVAREAFAIGLIIQ
ncbi:hypothetical protein COW80_02220 [Candidatus Beckwithbacteria bacterium CG22_combo_CG10-13_8_21_14_all_01_47_9]|uniref:Uncharacterized protein n=2 Tax=Candidatus Beckwithiibacteriota TaxID=1752726 RepID=A0A2H0E2D3_9BACT|nr:MAG: hypothetical protein COW80_02220 [Candidatus Beckwithbacteria bacterium CG22_combo_CG10-13_8_21_14_all_01_47_9]PJA21307.1 MAG: hypothetical protein COX59_04595 [Candidatus Beckwithbacteria bacterium CG_4_10_14_0_2_um_filter_47_25]